MVVLLTVQFPFKFVFGGGLLFFAASLSAQIRVVDGKLQASITTDPHARVYYRKIPAARGALLDRNGRIVLQSKVVSYPAIYLLEDSSIEKVEEDFVLKLDYLNRILAESDEFFIPFKRERGWVKHYLETRKWLPVLLPYYLTPEQEQRLSPAWFKIVKGYARHYPYGNTALHALGMLNRDKEAIPLTGYVFKNETLFYRFEALSGFEKRFNATLTGTEGVYMDLFDGEGNDLLVEAKLNPIRKQPLAGNEVELRLDIELQQRLESVLSQKKWRGALILRSFSDSEPRVKISLPTMTPMTSRPYITQSEMHQWMDKRQGFAWFNRFEESLLWNGVKNLVSISKTESVGRPLFIKSLSRKDQAVLLESAPLNFPNFQGTLWMSTDQGFEDSSLLPKVMEEARLYFELQ